MTAAKKTVRKKKKASKKSVAVKDLSAKKSKSMKTGMAALRRRLT